MFTSRDRNRMNIYDGPQSARQKKSRCRELTRHELRPPPLSARISKPLSDFVCALARPVYSVNDFQITVGALRETFEAGLMYAESAATLINLHCVMSMLQTFRPRALSTYQETPALMHINAVSRQYLTELSCLCR